MYVIFLVFQIFNEIRGTGNLKSQKLFQIREERIVFEEDVLEGTATDKTMRSTK